MSSVQSLDIMNKYIKIACSSCICNGYRFLIDFLSGWKVARVNSKAIRGNWKTTRRSFMYCFFVITFVLVFILEVYMEEKNWHNWSKTMGKVWYITNKTFLDRIFQIAKFREYISEITYVCLKNYFIRDYSNLKYTVVIIISFNKRPYCF